MAAAVTKRGGKIYENSAAEEIDFKKVVVVLKNQKTVKAKSIVVAANAPLFGNFAMNFKLKPQRSYVIAIKVPKGSIEDALYWDTEIPYHYIRLEEQDKTSDLLIVGGEDHRVGMRPKHDPFLALQQWAQKYFQLQNADISCQWSGQILEPVDYLAYIGRHPKNRNIFMVTGDSGNGITHGTLAASLIASLVIGKTSPYEEVYKIKRLPLRALKSLVANVCESMLGYLKYLLPQWQKLPKAGEGKVIQRGFKKIAVYKDENNKLKKCSGICTHLGAVLS